MYTQLLDKCKVLFLISIIVVGISLPFVCCFRQVYILIICAGAGYILFVILFYVYYDRNGKPNYHNPILPLVLAAVGWFFVPLIGACCAQTRNIMQGYTAKQVHSILEAAGKEKVVNEQYMKKLSCGENMKNIWMFLKAETGKSLFIPERDLFSHN